MGLAMESESKTETRNLPAPGDDPIELSVVMPCLNEAETLETCILKIQKAFQESGVLGEIIVADNGSTDGSPEIAGRLGVRVVNVQDPGYGNALMGGIAMASGKYIIMGDADDSYDFAHLPRFLVQLRAGADLVMGKSIPGRDPAECHADAAPVSWQPLTNQNWAPFFWRNLRRFLLWPPRFYEGGV
jgi:glycosyltransferase involved in cell wall biosynthesis